MSKYVGRHRAPVAPRTPAIRTTLGVSTVAAVGMALPATTAQAAPVAAPAVSPVAAASTAGIAALPSLSNFRGLVKQGDRGWIVKKIQYHTRTTMDGVYGPKTVAAVKRWQASRGLVADGIVGPRTGSRMNLPSTYTSTSTASRTTTRTATSSIVTTAARFYGTPYVWGGTTPSGFDCSGFTSYVYRLHGKSLPRTAEAQRQGAWKVSSPAPGDLVFFGYPADHVGIYAGNGQIIDAGRSGSTVSKRAIWTNNVTYGRY